MSDGRHFTDYHTRCAQNQFLQTRAKMPSSYDYRMYLTRNAETLMDEDRMHAMKENRCAPCYDVQADGTMLPESSAVNCDSRTCSVAPGNPAGLGQGRNYDVDLEAGVNKQFVPSRVSGSKGFYPIGGSGLSGYDTYGAAL
jgi:hypothetical protein